MYDAPELVDLLNDVGFRAGSKTPFESEISDILRVELESRTKDAVIVEGRKRRFDYICAMYAKDPEGNINTVELI